MWLVLSVTRVHVKLKNQYASFFGQKREGTLVQIQHRVSAQLENGTSIDVFEHRRKVNYFLFYYFFFSFLWTVEGKLLVNHHD